MDFSRFGQRCVEPTTVPPGTDPGQQNITVNFPDVMQVKNEPQTVFATYDGANYGQWVNFDIAPIGLTESTITFSTSNFRRSTDLAFSATMTGNPPTPANATNYQNLLSNVERVMAQNDTGIILSEGASTAFNEDYDLFFPVSGVIDQIMLNFAVALDVSVFTAGSFNLSSVDLTFKSYQNQGQPGPTSPTGSIRISPNSAFTALTTTGTNILIVRAFIKDFQFNVYQGFPLTLNITINETTGTGTRNIGIVDIFPYLAANQLKKFYTSQIACHVNRNPDSLNRIPQYSQMKISGVSP